MSTLDDRQRAFVQEELAEFATYLVQQARAQLTRRRIKVDDVLLGSLAAQTAENELKLLFADHGRYHDMGAGRGYHKGKFMGSEERGMFMKGRKPSKWYSPMVWGAVYGTLVNNLAHKYVAQVPGLLAQEFRQA